MFLSYIVSNVPLGMGSNEYTYTLFDSDFEHSSIVDFTDCNVGQCRGKIFDAFIGAYEDRELNAARSAFYIIRWLDTTRHWSSNGIPHIKQFSKKYQQYKDDIEKYMILL